MGCEVQKTKMYISQLLLFVSPIISKRENLFLSELQSKQIKNYINTNHDTKQFFYKHEESKQ